MAFIGSVNAEVRRWLGNIGPLFTGRNVVVGCSGNFTIEQLLAPHGPALVWGNDVSLYSSVLGAYLTGQPFRLEVKSEKLYFLDGYLESAADKAASVLLLSEALQYSPEKNPFQARLWQHYRTHFGEYHEKTVLNLERLRPRIRIDRYTSTDIFDLLDQVPPEALVIAFLPTYKGGYERLFKRLEESIEWDRPAYGLIDDERKEAIIAKLQAFAYIYIDDNRRDGLPCRCIVNKGHFKTVYLYSNLEPAVHYIRNEIGIRQVFYPMLSEESVIVPESRLSIQVTDNNVVNYYRNLYLSKGIDYVNGDTCYLVGLDSRLFGFLIFVINRFDTADIYLLADFVVPVAAYPRLSKLLLLITKTREIRDLLQEKYLRPIRTILTTAFTSKPVSMKYRGPYELHSRKPGRLNYITQTGTYDLKEVVSIWLKKYHRP